MDHALSLLRGFGRCKLLKLALMGSGLACYAGMLVAAFWE